MSRDTFWALIQEAKAACDQDMDAMEEYLCGALVRMGPAAARGFHNILHAYEDLAYQYGLWDAASVIKEYGCSDDGFIDFRAWLIAQGKDVYLNALKDPDTLADVQPYGECCFECLSYVGDHAYEQLTGRSAYDEMDDALPALREELGKEIVYKDGIEYPREPKDLPRYLPRSVRKVSAARNGFRWSLPHGTSTSMRSAACWTRGRPMTGLPKKRKGAACVER